MAQSVSTRTPRPAANYAEAVQRILALQALDGPEIREGSQTQFLTHGDKTAKTVVFYHGYTNAPQQYVLIGKEFYDRGYNVLIPRITYHGYKDVLAKDQEKLTATDLIDLTEETVDVAQGLGEQVTICGLSMGGVMAAWAAQYRADVDRAVGIAPSAGLPVVPIWVSTLFRKAAPALPNLFIWWDPRVKDKIVGPVHGYPRFSTHGLAQIFRMGRSIVDDSQKIPPAAKHIVSITSAFDTAISLKLVYKIVDGWKTHGADVTTYEFPKEQKVWHDMIDPAQSTQQIDLVYPIIVPLIAGDAPKLV